MADLNTVRPDTRRILDSMCHSAQTLPSRWDEGGFCLDAAIDLADHLARHEWRVSRDDEAMMRRVGAILLRSVHHQLEAGNLADSLMDGLRNGGACG